MCILSLDVLIQNIQNLRDSHQRIVFTNGCFDLLHKGHILYLKEAKACGDYLIVGLNSDRSVQALKGDSRPILKQDERALILSSLQFVDFVVLFDERTPLALIEALKPDCYVKGGDYCLTDLPEYPLVTSYGGDVRILSFTPGCSSSSIIQKIQNRV